PHGVAPRREIAPACEPFVTSTGVPRMAEVLPPDKMPSTRRVRHLEPESGRWAISGPIATPRYAAWQYRLHYAIHRRLVLQGRAPSKTDGLPIPFQHLEQKQSLNQ